MKPLSPQPAGPRGPLPDWRTPAGAPLAGSLVGAEHEYRVLGADGGQVDFRGLIHGLRLDGLRLDPGDLNAYRLRSGLVVTADGMEAETASPPVPAEGDFADALAAWAATGRRELERALDGGYWLEGYSTHISVALPDSLAAAERYARTFGPVLARLLEGPDSLGIYVRPRPGRIEFCGDYAEGDRLRLAARFAVASVRALATGQWPPEVAATLLRGDERFGYRLHRTMAFGFDSYAAGAAAGLPLVGGGSLSIEALIERAVGIARGYSGEPPAAWQPLHAAALAGPLRAPEGDGVDTARHGVPGSLLGAVLEVRERPAFRVEPEFATWGHTVFRAARSGRSAAICVETPALGAFLSELSSGAIDSEIESALTGPGDAPALGGGGGPILPGIYSAVADPGALLPAELPTGPRGKLAGGRPGKRPPGRIGKAVSLPTAPFTTPLPVPPPQIPGPTRPATPARGPKSTWWGMLAAAAASLGVVAGAAALLGGHDPAPPAPTTPPPIATLAADKESPAATATAPSPTAGESPSATPAGTTLPPAPTESPVTGGSGTATPPFETPPPAPTPTSEPTVPGSTLPPASTPPSTATSTAIPTPTQTSTPTASPTRVPDPTVTSTPIPTVEPTPTRILDPTVTPTPPKTPIGIPTPPLE